LIFNIIVLGYDILQSEITRKKGIKMSVNSEVNPRV